MLLALVGPDYDFLMVDIGAYGRDNDALIFQNSDLGQLFISGEANLPAPSYLDGFELPYVIVADSIFALQPWLMKPYAGHNQPTERKIFNYRLSRARHVSENAFGIMTNRFGILSKPINTSVETARCIGKACVILHNYLIQTDNSEYIPFGFVDSFDDSGNIVHGFWRRSEGHFEPFSATQNGHDQRQRSADSVRQAFVRYFNSPQGEVTWQNQHVTNTGVANT